MTREDPEDLRRRLYRRGASPADLAAYVAVAPEPEPEPEPGPPRRRRRGAILLPVAALAVAGTALVLAQPAEPAPTPTPTRAAAAGTDVQRAAVVASTTEAERDGFVRALSRVGSANLIGWLGRHGQVVDWSSEYQGSGRRLLPLDLPSDGARVEVLLVASRTAGVSWTLLAGEDPSRRVAIDRRSLYVTPGDVAQGVLRYPAGRVPTRLLVTAPAGVRWGAAVVADR